VEELARLHQAEWGHLSPQVDVDTRATRLVEAAGRSEIPLIFIAVDGPDLVGSAALVKSDMKERPELSPWLAAVYVKPESRKNGIASALISRVEHAALSLRVNVLYLVTEQQEKFYGRRGWSLMENADHFGTPVAVMTKQLSIVNGDD
ncbi:MAG: GNAT family N-acetyltransferase, partial [Gammaproteobacteria bacterium]|nr:GNAT family N-acetyltransferase [Gammaproteobacteria bacterium]